MKTGYLDMRPRNTAWGVLIDYPEYEIHLATRKIYRRSDRVETKATNGGIRLYFDGVQETAKVEELLINTW